MTTNRRSNFNGLPVLPCASLASSLSQRTAAQALKRASDIDSLAVESNTNSDDAQDSLTPPPPRLHPRARTLPSQAHIPCPRLPLAASAATLVAAAIAILGGPTAAFATGRLRFPRASK